MVNNHRGAFCPVVALERGRESSKQPKQHTRGGVASAAAGGNDIAPVLLQLPFELDTLAMVRSFPPVCLKNPPRRRGRPQGAEFLGMAGANWWECTVREQDTRNIMLTDGSGHDAAALLRICPSRGGSVKRGGEAFLPVGKRRSEPARGGEVARAMGSN